MCRPLLLLELANCQPPSALLASTAPSPYRYPRPTFKIKIHSKIHSIPPSIPPSILLFLPTAPRGGGFFFRSISSLLGLRSRLLYQLACLACCWLSFLPSLLRALARFKRAASSQAQASLSSQQQSTSSQGGGALPLAHL